MAMRSLNPAALLAAACLAFAACAGQGGSSSPSPATPSTSSPAAATTPSPAAAKQNLIFAGPAAGTLTDATTQCQVYTAQTQLNFALTGKLAGQDLTFNIQVNSGYKGPGTYQVGSLLDGAGELRLQVGSYAGASSTGAGTLIIDSDGKSGSIDADISGGEHIKGTFRCDQVQTQ
jgi:hypothetical protein